MGGRGGRPRVPGLDVAAARKYAGRPYAFGCPLLMGALRKGGNGAATGDGDQQQQQHSKDKLKPRAHYCTTLVAQFLLERNVLRSDVEPFRLVPRDFGDDTSRYGVARCLAAPWAMGPIVYLST